MKILNRTQSAIRCPNRPVSAKPNGTKAMQIHTKRKKNCGPCSACES